MGREIKRVPADFDWPLNEVWSGYLTPDKFHEERCGDCYGRGSTPARQWIERMGLMLDQLVGDIDVQARGREMHPWLDKDSYPPVDDKDVLSRDGMWITCRTIRPTPDIIEFAQALMEDDEYEHSAAQNRHALTRGLLRSAGLPEKWGWCPTCEGHGSVEAYEGQRAEAEAWQSGEPPTGDGWQLWETVSEGSPISPVFATAEDLAQWLTTDDAVWGAMQRPMTIDQARGFVGEGWAPSAFGNAGGLHDGATYVGTEAAVGGLFAEENGDE